MVLIKRISQLFKADFHAVLDQIEEPEQLLKQAIRDMEDDLSVAGQHINQRAHEQESLAMRKSEQQQRLDEFEAQLDLCFESENDELAKKLIRKKLEAQRLLKHLSVKHSANERSLIEQQSRLDENRLTLEGLKQKADLFTQHAPCATEKSGFDDIGRLAADISIGEDEVEIAFLREKNLRLAS
jgi:phage shock protein A